MSNYLNTAFAITFVGDSLKIVFAAPVSETIYINSNLFYIQLCSINSTAVDLGEYDAGITTVNYQLATAPNPAALTRVQWIAAVLALITVPNNAPTTLAASALTDVVVGYNGTQFTDLGNAANHRFNVYSTVAQAIVIAGTVPLYNVVVSDPMNGYNAATGIYTVPYEGSWTFGMSACTAPGASLMMILRNGATTASGIAAGLAAGTGATSVNYYCNVGDTIRCLLYLTKTKLSNTGQNNNFWGKRVV